ncbi:WXG100 family type VII secretion target [Streptomyces sp. NPDC056160]|uniref:WXG100 family type VII secretion target n=1 Tax=Streptomyces sp. NPDC056160 TaxID=3345731 RepID=UPI0035E2FD51
MGIDIHITGATQAHQEMEDQTTNLEKIINELTAQLDAFTKEWVGEDATTYGQVKNEWHACLAQARTLLAGNGNTLIDNVRSLANASATNSDSFRRVTF